MPPRLARWDSCHRHRQRHLHRCRSGLDSRRQDSCRRCPRDHLRRCRPGLRCGRSDSCLEGIVVDVRCHDPRDVSRKPDSRSEGAVSSRVVDIGTAIAPAPSCAGDQIIEAIAVEVSEGEPLTELDIGTESEVGTDRVRAFERACRDCSAGQSREDRDRQHREQGVREASRRSCGEDVDRVHEWPGRRSRRDNGSGSGVHRSVVGRSLIGHWGASGASGCCRMEGGRGVRQCFSVTRSSWHGRACRFGEPRTLDSSRMCNRGAKSSGSRSNAPSA